MVGERGHHVHRPAGHPRQVAGGGASGEQVLAGGGAPGLERPGDDNHRAIAAMAHALGPDLAHLIESRDALGRDPGGPGVQETAGIGLAAGAGPGQPEGDHQLGGDPIPGVRSVEVGRAPGLVVPPVAVLEGDFRGVGVPAQPRAQAVAEGLALGGGQGIVDPVVDHPVEAEEAIALQPEDAAIAPVFLHRRGIRGRVMAQLALHQVADPAGDQLHRGAEPSPRLPDALGHRLVGRGLELGVLGGERALGALGQSRQLLFGDEDPWVLRQLVAQQR